MPNQPAIAASPRRWPRRLLIVTSLCALVAAIAAGGGWWWLRTHVLSDLPSDLSAYRDWRPQTTCEVTDAGGVVVDEFYLERRYWVDIDELPDHVWQAFVAAEDARFFEHPGVDVWGIGRAVVANAKAGEKVQGGSTITQQLTKNLLVGGERTYKRKLREAVLAYRLDQELGKRAILELYINFVFLGNGNYGIEAAARDYYDRPAAELDAGQAAMIAGLVPAPSRYNPIRAPDLAKWRRALVLRRMLEQEYLSAEAVAILAEAPVLARGERTGGERGVNTAYLTEVRREVRRVLGDSVFTEGLRVRSALDTELQAVVVDAVAFGVAAHKERQPDHPGAQSAAIVVENATGRVIAMAGGAEPIALGGFNRATQARRQPGSSFKPYVYATALLRGRSPLDVVTDAPLSLPAGGGKFWTPKNYGGGFAGPMTLRRALASSSNTVAVRLALESGPEAVANQAARMGVATRLRQDLTIALGSSEVTPLDQALGYATIARLGMPTEPVYIDALLADDGRVVAGPGQPVLAFNDGRELGVLPGRQLPRALPEPVAYELLDMMREVVRGGTARRASVPGLDRAGKTGTTNESVDAWFVGMTPTHTVAVWVGTDGTASLGDRETGGKAALPIWLRIVEALPDQQGLRFQLPDGATLAPSEGGFVGLARAHLPPARLPNKAAPLPELGSRPPPPPAAPIAPL